MNYNITRQVEELLRGQDNDTLVHVYTLIGYSLEFNKLSTPFISFPDEWKVAMSAPFGGATMRFSVVDKNDNHISVYVDHFAALGITEHPHYEIYDGADTLRIPIENVDELIKEMKYRFDNWDQIQEEHDQYMHGDSSY